MTITKPPDAEPEFEIPPVVWGGIGVAIGFVLVFWLGLGLIMDINTDFGPGNAAGAAASGPLHAVATEFAIEVAPSSAAAGEIDITLDNAGAVFHNLEVEDAAGEVMSSFLLEADPGVEAKGVVDLAPGTYVLFCSVPGHREAGMETSLIVSS